MGESKELYTSRAMAMTICIADSKQQHEAVIPCQVPPTLAASKAASRIRPNPAPSPYHASCKDTGKRMRLGQLDCANTSLCQQPPMSIDLTDQYCYGARRMLPYLINTISTAASWLHHLYTPPLLHHGVGIPTPIKHCYMQMAIIDC
jgi:hypothetical protein